MEGETETGHSPSSPNKDGIDRDRDELKVPSVMTQRVSRREVSSPGS